MKQRCKSVRKYLPVVCLLLAACSADEMMREDAGGAPLGVSGVQWRAEQPEADTRAAGYTDITSGSMGLFLDNPLGKDSYQSRKNVKYTARVEGLTTKWESEKRLFLISADADVCAYYPYLERNTDREAVSLASRPYDAAYDLVYATSIQMNSSNNMAVFQMKRAYALLTLNIKRGNMKENCTVKAVTLGGGMNHSAKLNIADGTTVSTTPADKGELTFEPPELAEFTVYVNDAGVRREFLLVPVTLAAGLEITFTFADGQKTSATIGIPTLQAANQYVVNLLLNNTVMGASVTVDKVWTSHTVDDNGNPYAPI